MIAHAHDWTLRILAVALAASMLSACGLVDTLSGKGNDGDALSDEITVEYSRIGGSGMIDQALTVHNGGDVPVAIEADIEPLDGAGDVLRSVAVRGVYGATDGEQILVPGDNLDFLIFTGAGASKVRDVRLKNIEVDEVDFPVVSTVVEAVPLDRSGADLDYPAGYARVSLRNPNSAPVRVRVVSIVWNRPGPGETQQALKVLPLSELVTVPAGGQKQIGVPEAQARVIARYESTNALSLKAYYSM